MSAYREVPNSVRFPQLEVQVLDRWQQERTFERSLEKRAGGPEFVFYDGPPFATGLPHYGHILTSFIKDVVPRYFTMRGYHVPRRWGWDCHGLPVEFEVEKALGFSSRAEIVAHGVDRFNDTCRALVMRYQAEWETAIGRLGRWVDFANAYKTMDPDFVESVVWCFKTLHERGLVYEGQKVVAYCPRCQTALSNFEARLDDAYRMRDDLALTVRFERAEAAGQAFLAWTTTPWTLPSNAALAVHPDLEYVRLQGDGGSSVWLASAALDRFSADLEGASIVERRRGRELVGSAYRPLFDYFSSSRGAFRLVAAEFVTAEEGTGIVHLAPAFGEDDQSACAANGIEGPNPVRDDGTFDERVSDFAGLSVFAANEPVARALEAAGSLFRREVHRHSYPHCWRCDSPLVYRSIPTWFVQASAFKQQMAANNRLIRWVPDHVGAGRFADWLDNARDWAVSRNRFWGAPIPVWRCTSCQDTRVVGSREELERLSGQPFVDWHRPHIDQVTFPCQACGGALRRVPEVLDCWFESGAMPYGQVHYPFENKEAFEATFPGDFIVEYIAQTRGWFYTMLALSSALFDRPPFKNAVCHGVILAEDGRKMSKRLRNYPDPMALVEEHGSDALRAALLMSGAVSGMDIRFAASSVRDSVRRLHLPLWNVLHLFTAYAAIDGFEPSGEPENPSRLDRYLLSEAELLREQVDAAMDRYDFAAAYAALGEFITTLSTWYLRLTKPVLWRPGLDGQKRAAYEALHLALAQFAKVSAPFLPFLAESVHAALGGEESVHLEDWPAARPDWRDDALIEEMRTLRDVVRLARRVREQNGVRHRHPLRRARLGGVRPELLAQSRELLESELNVKEVDLLSDTSSVVRRQIVLDYPKLGKRLRQDVKEVARAVAEGRFLEGEDGRIEAGGHLLEPDEYSSRFVPLEGGHGVAAEGSLVVMLDLGLDEGLVREGLARDLNRALQDVRKRARLAYEEQVVVSLVGDGELAAVVQEHGAWLRQQCLATAIQLAPLKDAIASATVELGGSEVVIGLARAAQ